MFKNQILRALKTCYQYLPVGAKTRIYMKDKFYTMFSFALKNTPLYNRWYAVRYGNGNFLSSGVLLRGGVFQHRQKQQPGRIAIQLHLFYIDLIDDFCQYLQNMPFEFDLLVSIVDKSKKNFVEESFGKISHIESCVVRVVPNRGRDVAPFVVGFADLLGNYDFVAHIHSKKSLYTGSEQAEWRNYLLEGLLGNEEWIRMIFGEFMANENLGLIYPRPAKNVPYMAFTWLSNYRIGQELMARLKVKPNTTTYFDFPAGTMFWARSKAIKRLHTSGIRLDDFPVEKGQMDGTIAHAVERIMALMVNTEGMDYYEVDAATGTYAMNCGCKNMWQYIPRTDESINFLMDTDTISFDVFDTLVMRKIYAPSFVNELIGVELEHKYGIDIDFPACRLGAEAVARQKLSKSKDCSLDDIYKEFKDMTGLPAEVCQKIRELEVDWEVRLAVPRMSMVHWLKEFKKAGKRVILTSDMYLNSEELKRILAKCGVEGYDEIFVSSETGLRKDTGDVWRKFIDDGMLGHLCHIGDNEVSDQQLPGDMKFNAWHVMSSANLFSFSPFGNYLLQRKNMDMSLWGAVLLGTVLWRKFSDPFVLQKYQGKYRLKEFKELGYVIYGPILLTFICWLIREMKRDKRQAILFIARDGYFLQPLYEFVAGEMGEEILPSDYFLASRRAVTVSSLRTLDDILSLMETSYVGSIKDFFSSHFGIEIIDGEEEVILPGVRDKHLVGGYIRKYQEEIIAKACQERKAYEAYINSLNLDLEKKTGFVDIGYAGTIQYYISRLVESNNFIGYYMATDSRNRFGKDDTEWTRGCFAVNGDHGNAKDGVFKYQLLMETVLTSPDGQLDCFEMNNGKPVPIYGPKGVPQENIDSLREIHEGVQEFCKDVIDTYGNILLDMPIDVSFLDAWITCFVLDDSMLEKKLKEFFVIDDTFCNQALENVLDLYRKGRSN